jgi:hypothetical protein
MMRFAEFGIAHFMLKQGKIILVLRFTEKREKIMS